MITTEDVIRATGGLLLNGDMRISFPRVVHDSRHVEPGDLFVALKGPRFDGHDFVLEAISSGAKGALVEYWPQEVNIFELHRAISIIKVRDTLKALGDLAAYKRERLTAQVVAITGSCGKSTTKEMLATLLAPRFKVAKNPGNWNNLIGAPLSLLNAPEEAQILILEIATNRPGEISRLTEITKPNVAVLVSVHPSHLEGLGSFEGVLKEKLSLFEAAPKNAVFVYPYDQTEVQESLKEMISARTAQCLSFGLKEGANVRAVDLRLSPRGTEFRLLYRGQAEDTFVPLFGQHFVLDALAASAAALVFGLSLREVAQGLKEVSSLPGRLEPKRLGPHLILDDTYNANPASLEAACEVARGLKDDFVQAIAVVGDMKELGASSKDWHLKAGEALAQVFDVVLALGEEVQALAQGAGKKARVFPNKETLVEELRKLLREPSLVLVKGSRAMRMEEIVTALEVE